jgi:NADH:ubiquinone oxidoreductase subunit 5 (subunit L)/multisubunit Na+/H+ antiporter MnhA subunit
MEGPTPVSALIHAATMVTAGVYLLLKFSFLFVTLPLINLYLIFFGAMTAFVAATIGILQNDIKKIIAYSTCSQLGYMVFSAGNTNYIFSFYHLINHAFFKALLFLGAGAILHALSNEQDIRQMGALRLLLPLSYTTMFIGSLAIIGTPFFTGYYSKDPIIE